MGGWAHLRRLALVLVHGVEQRQHVLHLGRYRGRATATARVRVRIRARMRVRVRVRVRVLHQVADGEVLLVGRQ